MALSFHCHVVDCFKHIHIMNVKRDGIVFTIDLILVLRKMINYNSSFFIVLVQFSVQWWKFLPHHPEDSPTSHISLLWAPVAFYQGKTKIRSVFFDDLVGVCLLQQQKNFQYLFPMQDGMWPQTINQEVWIILLLQVWFQNNIISTHDHFTWVCGFFL